MEVRCYEKIEFGITVREKNIACGVKLIFHKMVTIRAELRYSRQYIILTAATDDCLNANPTVDLILMFHLTFYYKLFDGSSILLLSNIFIRFIVVLHIFFSNTAIRNTIY